MTFCMTCACGHRFPICLWKSFLHSNIRLLYCPACKRPYIIRKKFPSLSVWQRLKRALRTFIAWIRKKTDLKGYLRRRRERKKRAEAIKVLMFDVLNEPWAVNWVYHSYYPATERKPRW